MLCVGGWRSGGGGGRGGASAAAPDSPGGGLHVSRLEEKYELVLVYSNSTRTFGLPVWGKNYFPYYSSTS